MKVIKAYGLKRHVSVGRQGVKGYDQQCWKCFEMLLGGLAMATCWLSHAESLSMWREALLAEVFLACGVSRIKVKMLLFASSPLWAVVTHLWRC